MSVNQGRIFYIETGFGFQNFRFQYGFNSFTQTETSFTDFTKWTVSVFSKSINFLENENKMFYDIIVMFSFISGLKGVTVNTLNYPHSNTIKTTTK